jgi:hypothetical protein
MLNVIYLYTNQENAQLLWQNFLALPISTGRPSRGTNFVM